RPDGRRERFPHGSCRRAARCPGGQYMPPGRATLAVPLVCCAAMSDAIGPTCSTVLIVDDDRRIRDLLASGLAREGYTSETAAEGRTALARLARGGIDLVLLDLMMPELDGLAVCRQVRARAQPDEPYLPIIMLTARTEVADQRAGFAAGADDYIVKPFH